MTRSDVPLTLHHCHVRRLCRAGTCPLLEVTVSYPVLCPAEEGGESMAPAVVRFNETYRAMAEHLTEWAEGTLFEAVQGEFYAAGPGAAYRFDRRRMVCDMTADFSLHEDGEILELTVTRRLRMASRRGDVPEREVTATDRWRWPELTLRPAEKRRGGGRR